MPCRHKKKCRTRGAHNLSLSKACLLALNCLVVQQQHYDAVPIRPLHCTIIANFVASAFDTSTSMYRRSRISTSCIQCPLSVNVLLSASTPSNLQPSRYKKNEYHYDKNGNGNKLVALALGNQIMDDHDIQVSVINSNEEIISLADLRYKEWMQSPDDDNIERSPVPSLSSFRMATAEIYHERKTEGSSVFLAKMIDHGNSKNDNNDGADGSNAIVVGAAELSPIELKGVIANVGQRGEKIGANNINSSHHGQPLYITDVVASSEYRRCGIGFALMNALEKSAFDMGAPCVFLHVEDDNVAARSFYQRLGYMELVSSGDNAPVEKQESRIISISLDSDNVKTKQSAIGEGGVIDIDIERLAVNAGTSGQILMAKRIVFTTIENKFASTTVLKNNSKDPCTGSGFGKIASGTRQGSRKKKQKR